MCVWNEEDIIEATVRHCFAQGCRNVFIVDNGSTDNTVLHAQKAGAKLAVQFESRYFDEKLKIAHLNAVVRHVNERSEEDHIWWLYLDADEFPHIDTGLRLSDFLQRVDSDVRAVRGYLIDHLPTHHPYYVSPYHPADFMPLAEKTPIAKTPLVRYDKGKPHLYSAGGAHSVCTNGEVLSVLLSPLDIHHFPRRNLETMLGRLHRMLGKGPTGGPSRISWMDEKARKFENNPDSRSPYHARYEEAKHFYATWKNKALMTESLSYAFENMQRWYDPYEEFFMRPSLEYDGVVSSGIFFYFMGDHEMALCKFNDALELCKDDTLRLWILLKMASCLAATDAGEAEQLLKSLRASGYAPIQRYIAENHACIMAKPSRQPEVYFEKKGYSGGNKELVAELDGLMAEIKCVVDG